MAEAAPDPERRPGEPPPQSKVTLSDERDHGDGLLRDRSRPGHSRVGFLELFYDLVFVFAVTQLSHSLMETPTPAHAAETLLLFVAMWWTWVNTTWAMNWLNPDHGLVRLMVFVLVGLGLVMSMAIPQAFGPRGLAFALSYVAIQLTRTAFAVWACEGARRRNFIRVLIWFAAAAPLWIAGGLLGGGWRTGLWLAALAIDVAGPLLRFRVPGLGGTPTEDWDIEGDHMAERCALFIIIALGESLLVTGAIFARLDWTAENWAALAVVASGVFAMWWAYFDTGLERGEHHIVRSADPGAVGRRIYTYFHAVIVAGIVVTAVGDEMTLAHPIGHITPAVLATATGGPALYLLGNLLFKREVAGFAPLSHVVGLVLLGLGAGLAIPLHGEPLHLAAWATLSLLVTAVWERVSLARRRRPAPQAG